MGVAFNDDRVIIKNDDGELLNDHVLKKLRKFSEYFADLSAKSSIMIPYKPSFVGISCILAARMVNKIHPLWNPKFEKITNLSFYEAGIEDCFNSLFGLYDENFKNSHMQSAIHKKQQVSYSKTPD